MDGKILILSNNKDGLFLFRSELIAKLKSTGKEVILCYPSDDAEKDGELFGCKVISCCLERRGKNVVKELGLYRFYINIIKSLKPVLVITYTIKPNILGGLACRKLGVKHAANITGLGKAFNSSRGMETISTQLYKRALKKSAVVFFENSANMQVFTDKKIVCKSRLVLLSGAGVNLERFAFSPLPESPPVNMLFIGRLMEEKGINEFLQAAISIKIKYGSRVCFTIAGSMEEDYKNRMTDLCSDGIIAYKGHISDIRPAILSAHCIVLPSYHEGMSNALLEAAAMGRPLLTSDINGCKEAVTDGVTGYLFPAKQAQGLADAMEKFINLSDNQRADMGKLSRGHMERHFDKNKVVEKTVENLLWAMEN